MRQQIHPSFIPMALALLSSSCAVQIKDEQFCSPIPGNLGAVCDNFLTSNPLNLSEQQWIDLQASWNSAGNAVECTSSQTIGDIKTELEKLCSLTKCNYATQKAVTAALKKIENLGKINVAP